MKIMAVDDEHYALEDVAEAIREAAPEADLALFPTPSEALAHARENRVDVAFLDITMGGMSGVELARQLRELHPKLNIIFVTVHTGYMANAFSMHVSGYVLKPVRVSCIRRELDNLRHPVEEARDVRMHCFGSFEVFQDGKPLVFPRAKSKELLALLVDRRGSGVSAAEISAVLWPEKEYTRSMQKQVQTVIAQLMKTLKDADLESIIRKTWNSLAIHADMIQCDYYDFLGGDQAALNRFTGEYMSLYSWAEDTTGMLTLAKLNNLASPDDERNAR